MRTSWCNHDGDRQVTAFYYTGDVLGIGFDVYEESAEAITDVVLRLHRKAALTAHLDQAGNVCDERSFLRAALAAEHRRVLLLGRKTALQRVAAFFLQLPPLNPDPSRRFLVMNRADIADHISLTPHTVSRIVSELAREGYLAMSGRRWVDIRNFRGLRELAGEEALPDADLPVPHAGGDETPVRGAA